MSKIEKIKKAREKWEKEQKDFDVNKLLFMDESCAKTNMTRFRGRNLIGQCVNDKAPVNYECRTMISSVDSRGKTNCLVIERAMNSDIFKKYVSKILSPKLNKGDAVIMDNLSSHKNKDAIKKIEKVGAKVLFLPPYSPDYSPIEKM